MAAHRCRAWCSSEPFLLSFLCCILQEEDLCSCTEIGRAYHRDSHELPRSASGRLRDSKLAKKWPP